MYELHLDVKLVHGRLGEIAVVIALGTFGLLLPTPQNRNVPPEHSPELSFPVRLNGVWCTAPEMAAAGSTCAMAKGAGTEAGMQLPNLLALAIAVVPPTAWLAVQYWRAGCGRARGAGTLRHPYEGQLCAWRDGSVGLLTSLAVTALVTTFVKHAAGRPRPNYYALMELDAATYGDEAVRSFPSGHASSAMAGLHFLSLWLRFLAVGSGRGSSDGDGSDCGSGCSCLPCIQLRWMQMVIGCAVFAPSCLALWVAITRVEDHWHGYADVLGGSLIGFASAHCGFQHCVSHAASAGHRYESARPSRSIIPLEEGVAGVGAVLNAVEVERNASSSSQKQGSSTS